MDPDKTYFRYNRQNLAVFNSELLRAGEALKGFVVKTHLK
jgi:hypothetical protein